MQNIEQRIAKMETEIGSRRRSVKGMTAREIVECLAGLTAKEQENELSQLTDKEINEGIAELRRIMQSTPDAACTGGSQWGPQKREQSNWTNSSHQRMS